MTSTSLDLKGGFFFDLLEIMISNNGGKVGSTRCTRAQWYGC